MKRFLLLSAAVLILAACGGADSTSGGGSSKSAECPPDQKGSGVLVSSKYDYNDILDANKWRKDMFPRSCAGLLADLVPTLPAGYGIKPTHKPYVMNDNQVYLGFAELREPLYNEEGFANLAQDQDMIEFEIVRFTEDELSKVKTWMAENPDHFMTTEMNGQTIYLMGGWATGRQNKGDRLTGGLTAIYDKGIVVRLVHKSIYKQQKELEVSNLVETVMGDILDRAQKAGY